VDLLEEKKKLKRKKQGFKIKRGGGTGEVFFHGQGFRKKVGDDGQSQTGDDVRYKSGQNFKKKYSIIEKDQGIKFLPSSGKVSGGGVLPCRIEERRAEKIPV